jgi:uncharacterized membrane protein
MTEIQPNTPDASGYLEPGKGNVQLVYVLYLAGFVVGITPLVGLIFAYINRGRSAAFMTVTTPTPSAPSGSGCSTA